MRKIFLLAALGLSTACGGGGSSAPRPLSDLAYSAPDVIYLVGVPVRANEPTIRGRADSFSIEPDLPAGLFLDADTGVLGGTPEVTSPATTYRVTASGPLGSTDAELRLAVDLPPRFAFVTHAGDDTLSTWWIDVASGALRPIEYRPTEGEGPEAAVLHPNGHALYVPNLGDGVTPSDVTVYGVDPAAGTLEALGSAAVGAGAHALVLSPDGRFAYVTAFESDEVQAFTVDPVDGMLSAEGDPVTTGDGPAAIAVDPTGRFAYVANALSESLSIFRIQDDTGRLTSSAPAEPLAAGTPTGMAFDPSGQRVYVTLKDSNRVKPFAIDPVSGALAEVSEQATAAAPSHVAIHPTGRFAYVTSSDAGTVSVFELDAETGALGQSSPFEVGEAPTRLTFDRSGLYAYVTNRGSNDVSVLGVDPSDGALERVGDFRTRVEPSGLALTFGTALRPRTRNLYTVNFESEDLAVFAVDDASGALSGIGPAIAAPGGPFDAATDPRGRWMVVSHEMRQCIEGYIIEPDGWLVATGSPAMLAGPPGGVAVDPSGRFVYVVVRGTENVVQSFGIDPSTAALTPISSTGAGTDPISLAIDPTGRFVYASNARSQNITAWHVSEGQFVTGPNDASAPGEPHEVRFSPEGDRAWAALHASRILVPYAIDPHTGSLTPIPPGRPTEGMPEAIEVHPNGAFAYAAVSSSVGYGSSGYVASFRVRAEDTRLVGEERHLIGLDPVDLRLDPRGRHLWVLNRGGDDLTLFAVDPSDGTLSDPRAVLTGLSPRALAVTLAFE